MLPRAEAPARRLPYTTADMSERLAKRKAEQEAAAFKAFPGGVTKPFDQNGGASSPSWLSQLGGMTKNLLLTAGGTVADMVPYVANIPGVKGSGAWGYEPEDAGTSNFFQAGGQGLEQAGRRAVGDITAIPGVGKPSPSYTADQIREQGVALGVLGAALDYSNFIPVVAKGAGVTGDVLNAYKLARMERTANPFPALRGASNVIDVVEGSRVPARVVDAPIATPSERFGQALADRMNTAELSRSGTRDAGTIRLPGGEPTPELPAAQLQREAARAELGINIQDIEFPPKSNPLTRPQIIDDSGYGVFPNGAWKVLGLEQYNAGINSANLPNEMNALREYFGHDYDGFQETLRNPNPVPNNVFTEKIKLIDKIFEITPPTTEKFKVFRGVKTGGNYLSGDYLGAFYRSLQPGQLIIEPGYLSTSINKDIAQEWANDFADDYLLIINVPEGTVAVNPITSWEQGLKEFDEHLNAPTEEELLFNRGTVLRIIDNDMGVIHAEIVPNYTDKKQLLSLSQPKEALLKRYSYKDLAEMIADEDTQRDFYVAYFDKQPDINSLISKPNGLGMRAYDLADTIVELRYNVGFDPRDYWKFREIVDQITQTPAGEQASESLRNSTSQKLIFLFKKHQLLESDTIEFLQDNLEEILKPPPYNRLLDQ
jgi:hypothetical protein